MPRSSSSSSSSGTSVGIGTRQNLSKDKIARQQIKDVKDSVEAYFGLFQIERGILHTNDLAISTVALIQAVLATTKLTKVAIPSFGDIIQTFKNSGVKAASSAYIKQFKKEQNVSSALGLSSKRPRDMKVKDKYMDVIWNKRQYHFLNVSRNAHISSKSSRPRTAYRDKRPFIKRSLGRSISQAAGAIRRMLCESGARNGAIVAFSRVQYTVSN